MLMNDKSIYETSLFKAGNGTGIRIPKSVLNTLELNVGDTMQVDIDNGSIILTPTQHPTPDKIIVNGVLEVLEKFYKGVFGRYTQKSEESLNIERYEDLDITVYRAPLFKNNGKRTYPDILIPMNDLNDFKKLLSFLYDYFLISNRHNGFNDVVKLHRESLFDKWFHDSHDTFYEQWDVEKSIYYDWMKGRVLDESK